MTNLKSTFFPQNLTKCKCKLYLGSVAEMKGNEARSVFYLHPTKGELREVPPPGWPLSWKSLLLILATILSLGVLAFVISKIVNNKFRDSLVTTIGMTVSSCIMLVIVLVVFAKKIRLIGKPVLHTLPYYLALTRSCCEVSPY